MFQLLQACETGDAYDDVSQRHLLDKYQSFYGICCLHYQCTISERLIIILKLITFAIDGGCRQFSSHIATFTQMLSLTDLRRVTSTCTDVKNTACHNLIVFVFF